jgi:hypothetical protein
MTGLLVNELGVNKVHISADLIAELRRPGIPFLPGDLMAHFV